MKNEILITKKEDYNYNGKVINRRWYNKNNESLFVAFQSDNGLTEDKILKLINEHEE